MQPSPTVEDVFNPGLIPRWTYNPRNRLHLENGIDSYIKSGGVILSVSGPTKCGKTVLLRKKLEGSEAVWLDGSELPTMDAFWDTVAAKLNLPTEVTHADTRQPIDTTETMIGGGAKPAGIGYETHRTHITGHTDSTSNTMRRATLSSHAVREELKRPGRILVIDDLHFVPDHILGSIVRALKNLLLDGLRVIVASVDYRALDVLRAEPDMAGRFTRLNIPIWEEAER